MHRKIISFTLLLFVLHKSNAAISLTDILAIDPKKLLNPVPISDDDKRLLIDCLDGVDKSPDCPDPPSIEVLNKLKDLILKTKEPETKSTGLLSTILGTVNKVVSDGPSLLTGPSKTADAILKTFKAVKSLFVKENGGLPVDPYKDISDYLKSKGVVNINLIRALKTRAKLLEHFSSTNDDILHKYHSNYNVLIPHVGLVGVVRMLLDIYS